MKSICGSLLDMIRLKQAIFFQIMTIVEICDIINEKILPRGERHSAGTFAFFVKKLAVVFIICG